MTFKDFTEARDRAFEKEFWTKKVGKHAALKDKIDFQKFLHTERMKTLSWVREKIEGLKRKKGTDDYVLSDQNAWYNTALAELKKMIEEAGITNK